MKITALFFGGSSYAAPYPTDTEHFKSIEHAKTELWRRYHGFDRRFPAVEGIVELWCVRGTVDSIEYPDFILKIGSRGSVIVDNC